MPNWLMPSADVRTGFDDDQITAVIDAPGHLPQKVPAVAAHAMQIMVGPTGRAFALSNNLALPLLGQEHYILVSGQSGRTDEHGCETDLLAGLDVSPRGLDARRTRDGRTRRPCRRTCRRPEQVPAPRRAGTGSCRFVVARQSAVLRRTPRMAF